MKWSRTIGVWLLLSMVAGTPPAAAQAAADAGGEPPLRLLTLSSPLLRAGMDRLRLNWLLPESAPEFRLKFERPEWGGQIDTELFDRQLRGVEIRLPIPGFWLGYEWADEQEGDARAVFMIQRGF